MYAHHGGTPDRVLLDTITAQAGEWVTVDLAEVASGGMINGAYLAYGGDAGDLLGNAIPSYSTGLGSTEITFVWFDVTPMWVSFGKNAYPADSICIEWTTVLTAD